MVDGSEADGVVDASDAAFLAARALVGFVGWEASDSLHKRVSSCLHGFRMAGSDSLSATTRYTASAHLSARGHLSCRGLLSRMAWNDLFQGECWMPFKRINARRVTISRGPLRCTL